MMPATTRRDFLALAGGAAAAALLGPRALAADETVRAGLVVPAGSAAASSVRAGAEMGAEEARRAASLLGRDFLLDTAEAGSAAAAAEAADAMVAAGAAAVVGGVAAAYCAAIATKVPARFLEIRSRRELSPDDRPPGHLVVTPDHAAHARALAAALRERPDARELRTGVRLGPAPGTAVPVAWHHSLRRYGAAQLNDRFRTRTGQGMDENAWYGWMAVKLVLESALRNQPLAKVRTDGHKGARLEFRERRLHQPIYVLLQDGDGVEVLGG